MKTQEETHKTPFCGSTPKRKKFYLVTLGERLVKGSYYSTVLMSVYLDETERQKLPAYLSSQVDVRPAEDFYEVYDPLVVTGRPLPVRSGDNYVKAA